MIVRDFLQWVRTAPASERAEATSALARAYLYSDLSPDDLAAAEGAMLMLLDDPSPLVRRALADALAASPSAPPAIVVALAADQPQIAAPVYALSPLFVDADLVDAAATGRARGPGGDRQPFRAAAIGRGGHCGSRYGGGLPGAGRESATPISRRSRLTALSSVSATWRRSASRFWRAMTFPPLPARASSSSCPKPWRDLSPDGPGSTPITPIVSRARRAKKRR